MQVHLAKSDITTMPVDAVVNPANSLGIMGGGVAAALSRRGGPSIQREAMSLAPIAVGAAVDHGFELIAIPGMGTGLGGVDPSDAARAIVDELRAHRQAQPATVYLVDLDDEILFCLEEALKVASG